MLAEARIVAKSQTLKKIHCPFQCPATTLKADTHCVMSGAVTECLIRTGRETISLSWTAVVSVARRSVGSIGRPQGARVTRFRSWHSGDEAAGWAEGKVTLIKLSLRRRRRRKKKLTHFHTGD